MSKIIVIGAGIAGISAAYHARLAGETAVVYEARNTYGGLMDHFKIEGFLFDYGTHVSFTDDPYVRSVFNETPYYRHLPNIYNYEFGKWLRHPVQNNLYPLTPEDKVKAILDFIEKPTMGVPENYEEWLISRYGRFIVNRFPGKYTKKYWTVSASELSMEWLNNKMNQPSLEDVLFGAFSPDTENAYYMKEMRYPQTGGFRAYMDRMAAGCDIHFGKRVTQINCQKKYVEFSDGSRDDYDELISSVPLNEYVHLLRDMPASVRLAMEGLWATSVALVSVGFNRPDVAKYPWFYIYDEDIFPSRVCSPNILSPQNVPNGMSALQFEVYYSKHKPLKMSNDQLIQHVMDIIIQMKIAAAKEIMFGDVRHIPYGNVVFDHEMIGRRTVVVDYLLTQGIYMVGRFGEWGTHQSDESFLSGKNAVDRIVMKNSR